MDSYLLSDIAHIVGGKLIQTGKATNRDIRFLAFDSRNILSGKETLFFALKSERNDGHKYIPEAYSKEVGAFVLEKLPENHESYLNTSFILVLNSLESLQKLAAFHRRQFSYPVTGITGSNGKTIVKEWLAELLSPEKNIVRSPRSYNSQIGNPLSVWLMDYRFDMALFEAGISKPGEMERLEEILKPEYGLITHIGTAHLENFNSSEQLVHEKIQLFKNSSLIVYCSDFDLLQLEITRTKFSHKTKFFLWSRKYKDTDLFISSIEKENGYSNIRAIYRNEEISLTIPFTDDAHVENAIHCWAFMLAIGYQPGKFEKRFLRLAPIAMRLELKKGINGCTIINDSYNSDTPSLINALDFLQQQSGYGKKKSTLILSDILQSGETPGILYSEVADFVNLKKIDRLICIGPDISQFMHLFRVPDKKAYPSFDEFQIHFNENDFNHEIILLKGARPFRFDRISGLLQEKAHQTVMEINLDSMIHNFNFYRQKLSPGTKIVAMVKAFSYGTGSVEVARMLQYHGIDYLAVAIADEGIELRNNGIETPILVMNPEEHSFDAMIENNLEPNIYRFKLLERFDEALKRNAVNNFPVHIKIDTGMKRLGFDNEQDLMKVVDYIRKGNRIFIRSIFSHLAVSDDPSNDAFTREQFRRFDRFSRIVSNSFDYRILRHILNSSGIERFPEMELDMVRLGIGLYGVSPLFQKELKNVATLKTTISQIREVQRGETIGYGRRGIAADIMKIAVLPIGYADGFNRHLSCGNGKVFINGFKAPVVGSICMDMCMVDITGIYAQEGDKAIIFGEELPVSELAEWLKTIPYEILTSIGQRVKRIYFKE
jgi:alanine racemase